MPLSLPRSLRVVAAVVLAPVLALAGLLTSSCAYAQKITPQFWGLHAADWSAVPDDLPVGSANFTTVGTYWPAIQTGPSTFDWSRLDAQVAAARAHGAQPMIILGQTPKFFSPKPRRTDSTAYMPTSIGAWKSYVTKVAQRYGSRLDYQIWPEPNIVQNWQGTPRQMATLTMVASKAIKGVNRRAKVVSPAVALRLSQQRKWMTAYFKQKVGGKGVAAYVDAIAIDPFPAQKGTPEDSYKVMTAARAQLAALRVRKPLWNNEINYGVAGGGAATRTRYPVAKQQSYVIRTYALSAAARAQRTYWLGWFHSPQLAINMADDNGRELAPGKSYEVVRSWLNGTSFVGCAKQKSGLWTCTAKKGRSEVRRIFWKPSGSAIITTPRSTKRVENQSGAQLTGRRIKVTFKPIMVASAK